MALAFLLSGLQESLPLSVAVQLLSLPDSPIQQYEPSWLYRPTLTPQMTPRFQLLSVPYSIILYILLLLFIFFSFFTTEKESVNKGVKVVQICFLSWPRFSLSCYGVALWRQRDVYVIYKNFTRNQFVIPQVCCFIKSSNGSWSN